MEIKSKFVNRWYSLRVKDTGKVVVRVFERIDVNDTDPNGANARSDTREFASVSEAMNFVSEFHSKE